MASFEVKRREEPTTGESSSRWRSLDFRARLSAILFAFAVVPTVVLTLLWAGAMSKAIPFFSASPAWDRVAATGERAIAAARAAPLNAEQRAAMDAHQQELQASLEQALRFRYVGKQALPVVVVVSLVVVGVLVFLASRVGGHLGRQLGRPLAELVEWTERIERGETLPPGPARRGAPEFEVLRQRMREMSRELEVGRRRAIEAERAEAFRETARQVAHELKNPLTPIRFAVERLRRDVPPELTETVEVLGVESRRLEEMAKSFAQFGRLPEGPRAAVDVGELARYTARATVPQSVALTVEVADDVPMVEGHHDALARALSNVLINAVEACQRGGAIAVRVTRRADENGGDDQVLVSVRDSGCGMSPDRLARIWEPYVTYKQGGTGLGLAIARQTIDAHGGQVEATSAPGQGTEVRFLLPAGAPQRV
ncbi:MAG TPA: HAMP domain-containing sensor histidine kinase [Gemmatimonadaceae bacterium]|nr:HAMP domain-containing sensor histidine kinase [Gemmatimonadaceae bacterium]